MAAVEEQRLTFAEHIHELRKRLMWSLFFVAIGAGVGYALNNTILDLLQRPLNESLYYTTPTGGFSFVIKVCCAFGFVVALPVVVYQAFSFFGPLVKAKTRRTFITYILVSVLLASAGIAFAYFISLPAALHFLVNFGSNNGDIQALITADEYFNFVLAYIAGFAALFQLPLIIMFINRATPLKPAQLMGGTRYVVLASFIISAIITPTPDPMNQALMAGPIILLFFISVVVVAITNKFRKKPVVTVPEVPMHDIDTLLTDDLPVTTPIEPLPIPRPQVTPLPAPQPFVAAMPKPVKPIAPRPVARQFVSDMVVPSRRPAAGQPLARQIRPAPAQPIQPTPAQTRPTMQMGVISDFIPASR